MSIETNKQINKALHTFYVISLSVLVAGLVFIISYITVQAMKDPVVYKTITVDKTDVKIGDELTYSFYYCRNSGNEVDGNISRQFVPVELVNGIWQDVQGRAPVPLFQSVNVSNEKGCRTAKTTFTIPAMQPGQYKMRVIGNYSVLPILPDSVDRITTEQVINVSKGDVTVNELNEVINNSSIEVFSTIPQTFQAPSSSQPQNVTNNTTTNNTTNNTTNPPQDDNDGILSPIINPVRGILGL